MLRFNVYRDGELAKDIDLAGAYVFGQDSIPVRADLASAVGQVSCMKRVPGACGLVLLWPVGKTGKLLLPTTRLPERNKPYNLNVELARAQIMKIYQKREDWGLFDYQDAELLNKEFDSIRKGFVQSLGPTDQTKAAAIADKVLADAVNFSEKLAMFHAEILLARRKVSASISRVGFGCTVDLASTSDNYQACMRDNFEFIAVPIRWKQVEPKEHEQHFGPIDAWMNWAARNKKNIYAGPLLSFEQAHLPEWVYLWENDYDALRECIYEHIQRVVKRYSRFVRVWNVVSGIHAHNVFDLSFEQLMELTRTSCLLVKKLAPQSQVMIDLVMPWGEYYARNQRTIPPLLYADMAVQSGLKFDSFGLQIYMGAPTDGHYVRDLMQFSALLDEFVGQGKSLHVTCQVPSNITPDAWDAWGGKQAVAKAGAWHQAWSPAVQADWLNSFSRIGLSKPFVESICWRDLADYQGHYMPHGGLCKNDMEPKPILEKLKALRNFLFANKKASVSEAQK
ncbi:MAG: endo-1,4-beta-xylanase [Planctomycetes bacterium]|nr:endo-1,4-beta-xylanase [Planctomycetota bacterium]